MEPTILIVSLQLVVTSSSNVTATALEEAQVEVLDDVRTAEVESVVAIAVVFVPEVAAHVRISTPVECGKNRITVEETHQEQS